MYEMFFRDFKEKDRYRFFMTRILEAERENYIVRT